MTTRSDSALTSHTIGDIETEGSLHIGIAQLCGGGVCRSEEGWVADDVVGLGPGGLVKFAVGVVAQDGVGVIDVGQLLEEGFFLILNAMVVLPL